MDKESKRKFMFAAYFLVLGMLFGFLIFYGLQHHQRSKYLGWWLGNYNQTQAKEFVKNSDPFGDWICINIKNLDYRDAVETCSHEVGHEIFAEECEKDPELCFNAIKRINEEEIEGS